MDDVVKTDEDHAWGRAGKKAMSSVVGNHKCQYGHLAPGISLYLYCQRSTPLVQSR